jgi:hypothetical protein
MPVRKVSVSLSGLDIDVPKYSLQRPDVSNLDHVPGCEGVSEIMEANSGNLGPIDHPLKVPGG